MVLQKFLLNQGKKAAVAALGKTASSLYDRWKRDDLADKIKEYELRDNKTGVSGILGQASQQSGLERNVNGYFDNLQGRFRDYLSFLSRLPDYLKSAEQGRIPESSAYAAVERAKAMVAAMAGHFKGFEHKVDLYSDAARVSRHYIGNLNNALDGLVQYGDKFLNEKGLFYGAARRTADYLIGNMIKVKGIKVFEHPLNALRTLHAEAKKLRDVVSDYLANYDARQHGYAADLAPRPVYASV